MEEKINVTYIDATGINEYGDSINKGENYNIQDCILIRTTDIFPFDGIVRVPKNDNAYDFDDSSIMGSAIKSVIKSKYPNEYLSENEQSEIDKEIRECKVVFETCRSTIHFTMNGLVQSSMYGNFDDKPYVIFEPLKYHLDDSLKCLRVEDVYFNQDMSLSNEACILISEEFLNNIKSNVECLESILKFRVFAYRGNQQLAVRKVLEILGYDLFMINNHGYVNGIDFGTSANKMWNFSHVLAAKYNVSLDRHFYSEINKLDKVARLEKGIEIDTKHLFYIIDNSNIPQDLIEKIKIELNNDIYFNEKLDSLMIELINVVGLEKIKQLTQEFNNKYIEQLNSTKSKVHF